MRIEPYIFTRLLKVFPFLREAGDEIRKSIYEKGAYVALDPGQFISMQGNRSSLLPLVLSGTARVYDMGERGREITLYRVSAGESCILTASCILSEQHFPAYARAETPIEAVGIPEEILRSWMHRYEAWRNFLFKLLARRLASVISVVDQVAFRRMDARIAGYLHEAGILSTNLEITHEALAAELGSSREVVSRILKDFEKDGLISLSRGLVGIRDPRSLNRIAQRV
ncbi:MAG: Crp/Fnr family transcriptional regulator [Rhodothermales bacterium]